MFFLSFTTPACKCFSCTMMRSGSNPFRVEMHTDERRSSAAFDGDDDDTDVVKKAQRPHALIWYARLACVLVILQVIILALIAVACVMATKVVYSIQQDVQDVINPAASGVLVQQTIRNARDMTANPFLHMLGSRYDDALAAARNTFQIIAKTNELIQRSNATYFIPHMISSLAQDIDDIHKLLSRFQAPL